MEQSINLDEIAKKLRKALEGNENDNFTKDEIEWLEKHGSVAYSAYKMIKQKKDLDEEIGEDEDER